MGLFKRRLPDNPTEILKLPFEEAKGTILPRLARPFGSAVDAPSFELVPSALSVYLAVDAPMMMAYVTRAALDGWQRTFDQVLAVALENLRALTPAKAFRPLHGSDGVMAFQERDTHDASRALLIRDFVSPWPKGGVVAGIPSRDVAAFVPVATQADLAALRGLALFSHDVFGRAGNHAVARSPFWFDGQKWRKVEAEVADTYVDVVVPDGLRRLLDAP